VQFQTLTAIVKLFLKKPENSQGVVQQVLEKATKECDSADIRDRAYIYWRLLSSPDTNAGRSIILAERPPIEIPLSTLSPVLLDELLSDLSSLASAYHKPESTFIGGGRTGADELAKKAADRDVTREKALATVVQGANAENLLDFGMDEEDGAATSASGAAGAGSSLGGLEDLMDGPSNDLQGLSLSGSGAGQGSSAGSGVAAVAAAQSTQLNDLLGL